jgi:hypothetical protein
MFYVKWLKTKVDWSVKNNGFFGLTSSTIGWTS